MFTREKLMPNKSPFYIVDEFISPLQCEDIIERLDNRFTQKDNAGNILSIPKVNRLTEMRVMPSFKELIPDLETYFDFKYLGTTKFIITWYPTGYNNTSTICDNSMRTREGWKRIFGYDFTCLIFLNDFRDSAPFDEYYEVKGGKHEYITHGFGFNPTRGTMIFHPSSPNFEYSIAPILAGNLNVIRFNVKAETEYEYNMNNFQGDFKTWFKT